MDDGSSSHQEETKNESKEVTDKLAEEKTSDVAVETRCNIEKFLINLWVLGANQCSLKPWI